MAAVLATGEMPILATDAVVDTPVVAVDRAIMQRNIETMASLAQGYGVSLRPHAKTHKCPQIASMQLAAGATGVTCAKLGEAEALVDAGAVSDILIAYPIVGASKIERLLAFMARANVTVALDSREAATALSNAVAGAGKTLAVFVEVNSGQDRAGAKAGAEAASLAFDIAQLPGLEVTGVMTHEGHAGFSAPEVIAEVAENAGRALVATADRIRAGGIPITNVSVGSTPSSWYSPRVPGVTEMRPGTYVFNDNNAFRHGRIGPADCAARVIATVVSRPAPDRAILDSGSKALALDLSPSHPGFGYIVGHPTATIVRLSEEHGVVQLPPDEPGFVVGDRVEIIPNHVCPAVNLTDDLFVVSAGQIVDIWPVTARGKVR